LRLQIRKVQRLIGHMHTALVPSALRGGHSIKYGDSGNPRSGPLSR
jgi:hypothetical protein